MDCRLPDSSVQGIFQARILEWVAISFWRRSNPCILHLSLNRVFQKLDIIVSSCGLCHIFKVSLQNSKLIISLKIPLFFSTTNVRCCLIFECVFFIRISTKKQMCSLFSKKLRKWTVFCWSNTPYLKEKKILWSHRSGYAQLARIAKYPHKEAISTLTFSKASEKLLPIYNDLVQFSSVAHSCPTLCNPMYCSTPGFPVHH